MKLPKNGIRAMCVPQELNGKIDGWAAWTDPIGIEGDQPCRIFSEADAKELLEIKRVYGSDYDLYKNIKTKKKGKL